MLRFIIHFDTPDKDQCEIHFHPSRNEAQVIEITRQGVMKSSPLMSQSGVIDTLSDAIMKQSRPGRASGPDRSAPSLWRQCPFCGDERRPEVESKQIVDAIITGVDPHNGPVYWAECQRCGARGPLVGFAADAVDAWNNTSLQNYAD